MVFAPAKYGGLNLPYLYSEANMVKLLLVISHCRANSLLGQLITTNLNWIQINLGIQNPLLFETNGKVDYLEPNWFTGLESIFKRMQTSFIHRKSLVS